MSTSEKLEGRDAKLAKIRTTLFFQEPPTANPDEVWRLAMIAAPFVAQGKQPTEALRAASELLNAATIHLGWQAIQGQRNALRWTLDTLLAELGIKRRNTIKEYLDKCGLPQARAETIWKSALAGEPAFDHALVGQIWSLIGRGRRERQEKAAEARQRKHRQPKS